MLPFFPVRYPDEHFYSIVVRYHARVGRNSIRSTMSDLMGDNYAISTTHFPVNLAKLYSRLPKGSQNTPASIIRDNSMLPIFRPFISKEQGDKAEQLMISTNLGWRQISLYMPYNTRRLLGLKFCPDCVEEELGSYGESYWHRSHLFSGVRVCYKHHTWLYTTDECRMSTNSRFFCTPHRAFIGKNNISLKVQDTYQHHLTYSFVVNSLFENNIEYLDMAGIHEVYRLKLRKSSRLYSFLTKLIRSLELHFGPAFVAQINYRKALREHKDWLYNFIDNRAHFNPLFHIVMMMYLDIDLNTLVVQARQHADSRCCASP